MVSISTLVLVAPWGMRQKGPVISWVQSSLSMQWAWLDQAHREVKAIWRVTHQGYETNLFFSKCTRGRKTGFFFSSFLRKRKAEGVVHFWSHPFSVTEISALQIPVIILVNYSCYDDDYSFCYYFQVIYIISTLRNIWETPG